MGFLDKLKPQPRWKHVDPAVRLEALKDLDDSQELGVIAESDPDVRVRRAAVGRVAAPEVLGRIAANDVDSDLRDRAADRLVVLSSRNERSAEGAEPDVEVALSAVRQLTDPRRLSTVAKADVPEAVGAEALTRIHDERALGSIARQAKRESTAAAALQRLTDVAELLDVTLHAASAEVAIRAFDQVAATPDLATLRSIEAHAQHKAVTRRARALILELEQAEVARQAALEERRRRESGLCDGMEQVASLTDLAAARGELARIDAVWAALGVSDPALVERFARAQSAAELSIARREREAAEAADLRRLRAEAIATRDALCARVETLDGDDVLEQLIPIEEEWRSLLPLVGNGPEADRLAERFAQAVAACRKRHEMGALLAETRVALDALVTEAEGLSTDDATAAARWQSLSREARGLTAVFAEASRPAEDLAARLSAVDDRFAALEHARQAAVEEAADRAKAEMLGQFRHVTERAKRAAEADAITLREGERLIRDITTTLDLARKGISAKEVDDAVARLRGFQEQIAPRVRELREMDEWRRFANAQRQEQLIAMAEAIVLSLKSDDESGKPSDLAATARALRELNAKWQEVAEAPRQNAQRLWDRFRTATDFIRGRCETYFAKMREDRGAALEKKTALVEEAEALATSTDWARAAVRFQQMQADWQAMGPVARDAGRDLAQRFRSACTSFFARRREDLTDRKKTWSENLSRKEALCARAEALADSTDWDAAATEMKRMQADWKTIGPVRRNKSEVVWNRFRAAADRFFNRYHNRHELALAAKLGEREALVVELENLSAADRATWLEDLGQRVQELRTTWNRSVPIPAPQMKALADRWQTALAQIVTLAPQAFSGTDLDPTAVVQRMEKLVARVESFLADLGEPSGGLSPTEMLAARLRSALASNAMGGRVAEEAKWRAAADAVKDAQVAWQRLAPATGPEVRALTMRFREACRQVTDRSRRQAPMVRHQREREAAAV